MDLTIPSSAQNYLNGLSDTQAQMAKAQMQVSSGLRLQNISDDPGAVAEIYKLQASIASTRQTQSNLSAAGNEVAAADTSLQSAVQAVESAISLATQGATSAATATDRANLAQQVSGLQQTLLSLSLTQVNGSYIFSGNQPGQPSYQLDPTQPNGVKQLLNTTATRSILDGNGSQIAIAQTAQQIFDAQDSNGNPTTSNVFAALNSLLTGLQNNDLNAVTNSLTALHAADDHLNSSLAFYGETESRLTAASSIAQKFLTSQQAGLSQTADADVPSAALALTQATTHQQAALSVEAKIQQLPTLFSLLA